MRLREFESVSEVYSPESTPESIGRDPFFFGVEFPLRLSFAGASSRLEFMMSFAHIFNCS